MLSNSRTAREILVDVVRFHGDLADRYKSLRNSIDDPDTQLLLEYLQRHEYGLQRSVMRYGTELREEALETPLDVLPHLPTAQEIPNLKSPAVESVVQLGKQMDHALITLYEKVAASARDTSVRRLFRALLNQERNEQARLEMAKLCLQDI